MVRNKINMEKEKGNESWYFQFIENQKQHMRFCRMPQHFC